MRRDLLGTLPMNLDGEGIDLHVDELARLQKMSTDSLESWTSAFD